MTYNILSDEFSEVFSIDKTKGEILTKIRLDREVRKMYELPVIATDGGGRSGFTTVKIELGDLNDNAPKFCLRDYKTSIYGSLAVNVSFLDVSIIYCPLSKAICMQNAEIICFLTLALIDRNLIVAS